MATSRYGVPAIARYEVFLEPAEEGGYTVVCPALPGCISESETRDEALCNIQDASNGYLIVLKKHGLPTPMLSAYHIFPEVI